MTCHSVNSIRIADPDPGSDAFLTPGSGMKKIQIWDPINLTPGSGKEKNSDLGSGINIHDHISESLVSTFWLKNTSRIRIRDPVFV
jgi:hypothetical protein